MYETTLISSLETEDLNCKLYNKIALELEDYKKSLLSKTPEEILSNAYIYEPVEYYI